MEVEMEMKIKEDAPVRDIIVMRVLAVEVPLDGISTIVQNKDNRLNPRLQHNRQLLNSQLPKLPTSSVNLNHPTTKSKTEEETHKLPSPTNKIVLPSPKSSAASAAPKVAPTVHPILPHKI